jgi:hypothetical protein
MNIIVINAILILSTLFLGKKNPLALRATAKKWLSKCLRAAFLAREVMVKQ